MNKPTELIFVARPTAFLELPLPANGRIARPEQVILKIWRAYHDVGAYCYALRSDNRRKVGQAREVVMSSFMKHRPKEVLQVIKFLNQLKTNAGKNPQTVHSYSYNFKMFMDWADHNELYDCLSGGEATRFAFENWCTEIGERFNRHKIGPNRHNYLLTRVRELLVAVTGLESLARIGRKVHENTNPDSSTEPATPHDFAHSLALNQALFDGLCDLVLENKPFPYQLPMPKSLAWKNSFLWLFPVRVWRLPPHLWGEAREKLGSPHWVYNYEHGRLATFDEIAPKYIGPRWQQQQKARNSIKRAQWQLQDANGNSRHWIRIMLGMIAHNAFMFLFFSNTACNESVAGQIETDGTIDTRTMNQNFRSIKFRAMGKPISLETPASFLPTLRRFMKLRHWLLNGEDFPYLFFTFGTHNAKLPEQVGHVPITKLYAVLREIDPQLPKWGSKKIRATVADYYHRQHGVLVTSDVLQNSPDTSLKNYNTGSPVAHHVEMTLFLEKVAETSKMQIVEKSGTDLGNAKPLEEGGHCSSYGHPQPMGNDLPVEPDCKQGQGCLFCQHRILVACEEDARKVASAALVMEQVILGPLHEAELRPLIRKCDDDLEMIANFPDCREMVNRVKKEVFENGDLTPFFADKFQLFLELGVIA